MPTPETLALVEKFNAQQHGRLVSAQRQNPATFSARHNPALPPYAVKYALWLVQTVPAKGRRRPHDGFGASNADRLMKLQSLTHCEWNWAAVKALHNRADFRELIEQLTSINAEAVRTALTANGYRYVEILEDSVEQLHKDEDFKTAGELAMKAINQILPKGPDVAAATAISITIGEKRLQALDADAIVVETTPLE